MPATNLQGTVASEPERENSFADSLARQYLLTVAAVSGGGALFYAAVPVPLWQMAWIGGICATLCAAAMLLNRRHRCGLSRGAAVLVAALGVCIAVAISAMVLGYGVNSTALGFLSLQVCIVSVLVGPRSAFWLAGASALLVLGLAAVQLPGWALSVPTFSHPPLALRVITHLMLLATGVAIGLVLSRAVNRARSRARLREQRFAGLLAVAADWYWEMDAQFRFTRMSQSAGGAASQAGRRLGKTPWEIEGFGVDAAAMDAHRADLESRQPFSGLVLKQVSRKGEVRWLAASGRPRFDERGVFIGYWGVGRDITADRQADLARAATEARYRELFARSPSALVLHRDVQVLDANAAALALLDVGDAAMLIGRNLLDFYDDDDGSRRTAAERGQTLHNLPVGEATPARQFVLHTSRGRRIVAQVTSVKVDADGGPAILSIYQDDTARLQSEAARARSEALMTHLVATSPDSITLTDLATGRYVMVNDAFARLSGWAVDEIIGHTALELGVWPNAEVRENFVREVTERGEVRNLRLDFVNRAGGAYSLRVSAARFTLEGRDYLVTNGRDVTAIERERLERDAILENASIGIAVTRDRTFQLANPKFEQMFGWPPGTLLGQPGAVVWPSEAAYAELGGEIGPALARGEPVEAERIMARRDGSTFLCRLLGRAVDPAQPGQGATIWIAEDVTERRADERTLARARDDAEAANRAKSAFLANTSHEIRTPLNGLVGLARMARQPGLDEARRDRYLQQIDDSAQALSGVISDILDLSKIEAGKLSLETAEFDLHVLLESIEQGYAALADARALALEMVVRPGVPRRVSGDSARLRQVLSNFLSNALKFTAEGSVRIEVRPLDASWLRFEVHDTGPGIDPAVQARLFTPFTQADDSTTRRFGGTGLGLSICRELARLMDGEVGVISAAGKGCCFWAELPLPASGESDPQSVLAALPESTDALAGLRVLIAEDNAVNMLIATALLEQWGVLVSQAGDGAQAVAAVDAQADAGTPFALVLMDVQMPVMGGYEATRALRRRHAATELPIIALTAAALTSEREEALACGMNDFLTKPIDAQRLHDVLLQSSRAKAVS